MGILSWTQASKLAKLGVNWRACMFTTSIGQWAWSSLLHVASTFQIWSRSGKNYGHYCGWMECRQTDRQTYTQVITLHWTDNEKQTERELVTW